LARVFLPNLPVAFMPTAFWNFLTVLMVFFPHLPSTLIL